MAGGFEYELQLRGRRYRDAERGLEALARDLGTGMERAGPVLAKEVRVFLEEVADSLAKRHGRAWPGGTTDKTLSKRSGKTIAALKKGVKVSGTQIGSIKAEMTGPVHLYLHEYGGTIRPKKAKYLAYPLPDALKPDGTPKRRSPRQWRNTFVGRSKSGNLVIYQRKGRRVVALYMLLREARISARLGLRNTVRNRMPRFVDRAADLMARELMGHG